MEETKDSPSELVSSFQYLPIGRLKSSPLNPRKHFDPGRLAELADSFRGVGVIEPLVVRPVNAHFEIVCGERRSRAATIAKLESVPVLVKDLTDAQALEIMVIENNQREDVNALEEADGFSRLLKAGYDIDRLADRLGRSKKYVYDRVKLLDLVPAAKQLVLDNRVTAGHAILIARLKPEQQARVLDPDSGALFQHESVDDPDDVLDSARKVDDLAGMKPRTVRELQHWMTDHVRFDAAHFAQAAPLEFGEVGQRIEQAASKPGRGKKVISITFEHFVQPEARSADGERTFGHRSFKFADGKTHTDDYPRRTYVAPVCDHAVLGVVVAGERYGQAFDVCVARDKCQVHWKAEIADREKNQRLREKGQTQKADKNEAARRQRAAAEGKQRELAHARRELVEGRALHQAIDGVSELTPELLRLVLVRVLNDDVDHADFNKRFGTKVGWRTKPADLKSLSGKSLAQALLFAALSSTLAYGGDDFEDAIRLFKVDLKKIEDAVLAEEAAAAKKAEIKAAKPVDWKDVDGQRARRGSLPRRRNAR
jgi:ParB/RepB/Spo0J family partition protein